jgi:hypothetical protein
MGDADLRELLDADAIAETEEQLQALTETTGRGPWTASTICCCGSAISRATNSFRLDATTGDSAALPAARWPHR